MSGEPLGAATGRPSDATRSAIAVATAQPVITAGAPPTNNSAVARSGPPSTLTLSQCPCHRLATVSSRELRTIAGSNAPPAGRNVVSAASATIAATTTAAGGAAADAAIAAAA